MWTNLTTGALIAQMLLHSILGCCWHHVHVHHDHNQSCPRDVGSEYPAGEELAECEHAHHAGHACPRQEQVAAVETGSHQHQNVHEHHDNSRAAFAEIVVAAPHDQQCPCHSHSHGTCDEVRCSFLTKTSHEVADLIAGLVVGISCVDVIGGTAWGGAGISFESYTQADDPGSLSPAQLRAGTQVWLI